MKKIYLYTVTVILLVLLYTPSYAQIDRELGEFMILRDNPILLDDFELYSETNCCGVETLDDISFGYNISTALYSHNLIKAAREKALNDWFNKQNNLIKGEIEKQLNQNFSSYSDAQTAFYKNLENTNIRNNISIPINKYIQKVDLRIDSKNISVRNLKLLALRENEIKSGIISNSNYGYLKFNDTPLNQITSLSQLELLRKSEIEVFGNRHWPYVQDNNILIKLGEIPYNNQDILNRLKDLQINYYNSFDRWERLDLMQLYLNHVKVSYVLAYNPISPVDYGTPNYLENYAIGFASPYKSPFHPDACPPIRVYIGGRIGWIEKPNVVCNTAAIISRQEIIDEELASFVNIEHSTTQYINNIENSITGEPIELYLIAKYRNSASLNLSLYSVSSNEIKVGEYFLKPHYSIDNNLVFYSAYRVDNNGKSLMDIEYIIKKEALQDFQNNISFYTVAANMFYNAGIPSEGQIAFAARDYWTGLGSMWHSALHSEEWWAFTILSFGQAIVNLPINTPVNSVQTVATWRTSFRNMTKSFQGKTVVNQQGVRVVIDIPDNYVPSMTNNSQGINFKPNPAIGSHVDAGTIRIMGPTQPGTTYPYPKGYVVFYNNLGQPFNPISGQTLNPSTMHFSFN